MSLTYPTHPTALPMTIAAIGLSLGLHGALPLVLSDYLIAHDPLPQERDSGVQGAILFDLSDVIAAPAIAAEDSQEIAESAEVQTQAEVPTDIAPAQSNDAPLLQQTPYLPDDDSLQFDIATPEPEAETEEEATEIAEEFVEDKPHQESVMGAQEAQAFDASVSGVDAKDEAETAQADAAGLTAEQTEEITEWQRAIVVRIAQAKTYPRAARAAGAEGEVRVLFTMDRYGKVIAQEIETSSGHRVLDDAALLLLDELGKMPTPPTHLAGESFSMVIPLNYAIRK
jgi:protein TonB